MIDDQQLLFKTRDHPEANGRQPQPGERAWLIMFPLADGRTLGVEMGREGRANLLSCLYQELRDDEHEEQR